MVPANVLPEIAVRERKLEELNPRALRQVDNILTESERVSAEKQNPKAALAYRVPFAGVRYYQYV